MRIVFHGWMLANMQSRLRQLRLNRKAWRHRLSKRPISPCKTATNSRRNALFQAPRMAPCCFTGNQALTQDATAAGVNIKTLSKKRTEESQAVVATCQAKVSRDRRLAHAPQCRALFFMPMNCGTRSISKHSTRHTLSDSESRMADAGRATKSAAGQSMPGGAHKCINKLFIQSIILPWEHLPWQELRLQPLLLVPLLPQQSRLLPQRRQPRPCQSGESGV